MRRHHEIAPRMELKALIVESLGSRKLDAPALIIENPFHRCYETNFDADDDGGRMSGAPRRSFVSWIGRKLRRQMRHGSIGAWARHAVGANTGKRARVDFYSDGLGVRGKNLSFLDEPAFAAAWAESRRLSAEGWGGNAPDIRWRAHVACWAAKHALSIEGDFVECGVHTGLLSRTICRHLDFGRLDRRFWLFDTWSGIPTDGAAPDEAVEANRLNKRVYNFDAYPLAERNFAPYPNVRLVRGMLPGSLASADLGAVAYLSMDLNNAAAEKAAIEALWPRLSKGAMVLLDDYAFVAYKAQHAMWNAFAASVGSAILTLPTGQGLMIR
jgi:O-methyltransferase